MLEKSVDIKGFYRSQGAIFPDGKRICVNGSMDLYFFDMETLEVVDEFQGEREIFKIFNYVASLFDYNFVVDVNCSRLWMTSSVHSHFCSMSSCLGLLGFALLI